MRPRAPTGITLAGGDGPDYPGEFVGDSKSRLCVSRERWTFRAQARSLSCGSC